MTRKLARDEPKYITQEFVLKKTFEREALTKPDLVQGVICVIYLIGIASRLFPFIEGKLTPPERQSFDFWISIFFVSMFVFSMWELYVGAKNSSEWIELLFLGLGYPIYTAIQGMGSPVRNPIINEYTYMFVIALFFGIVNLGFGKLFLSVITAPFMVFRILGKIKNVKNAFKFQFSIPFPNIEMPNIQLQKIPSLSDWIRETVRKNKE